MRSRPRLAPLLSICIILNCTASAQQGNLVESRQKCADLRTILDGMAAYQRMKSQTLICYAVDRTYRIENKRVQKSATLRASMLFVAPHERVFEVQSHSGSAFLRKAVLNRLIETEKDSARSPIRERTAITTDNYDFMLLRTDAMGGRVQYVLRAEPKRDDRLLFTGTVWVDAEDYAVCRIEGRPARNPSFWIRRVDFVHEYQKFGPFWLSVRNSSVAAVFLFGRTTTELEYSNYRINESRLLQLADEIRRRGAALDVHVAPMDKPGP